MRQMSRGKGPLEPQAQTPWNALLETELEPLGPQGQAGQGHRQKEGYVWASFGPYIYLLLRLALRPGM